MNGKRKTDQGIGIARGAFLCFNPLGRIVGLSEKWPLAQLLPTDQTAFPVATGPKLRLPVVSGKPHRKMPERAVLLKGFGIFGEVSGNLMIHAR